MAKYLVTGSYTLEGLKGIQSKGGSARRNASKETVESVGGALEAFYFGFGDEDFFAIADLPSNEAAAALAIAVNATGGVALKTTVLLTPEEVDAAAEQSVSYRPPGQ